MWALVPLKSPETAKSRLAGALGAGERRDLFFAMARHVLETLRRTPGIERVAVITASDAAAAFARDLGCDVIREPRERGTAAAFGTGIAQLPGDCGCALMIAGDLPRLTVEALAGLLAAAPAPGATIAPDRSGRGTNALVVSPPGAIPPCFGEDSFRRHVEAAQRAGVTLRVFEHAALAFDVDVAEDLVPEMMT